MVSVWTSIVNKTCKELSDKGFEIEFKKPNATDTHVKTNTGLPCTNWAFCRSSDRLWVELEILPRTRQKQRVPQEDLYRKIKNHSTKIEKKFGHNISWDEEDRYDTARLSDRRVFRIKSYIESVNGSVAPYEKECVERMVNFILVFRSI